MAERNLTAVLKARDELSATLKNLHRDLGGLNKTVAESKLSALSMAEGFLAGGLALEAFNRAAEAVTHALKDVFAKSMDAQKVNIQLEAAIRSTGGAAGVTAKDIRGLAADLQKLTGIDDEQIIAAQRVLLIFENIGSDVFPAATKAVMDVSAALGQDLKQSAEMVGRALEQPANAARALRGMNILLSDSETELLKKFEETNNLVGAQAFVLKKLADAYGGTAQAVGETFGGQMARARSAIADVEEKIGEKLLPRLGELANKLAKFVESGGLDQWADAAIKAVTKVGEAFDTLGKAIRIVEHATEQAMLSAQRSGETFAKALGFSLGPGVDRKVAPGITPEALATLRAQMGWPSLEVPAEPEPFSGGRKGPPNFGTVPPPAVPPPAVPPPAVAHTIREAAGATAELVEQMLLAKQGYDAWRDALRAGLMTGQLTIGQVADAFGAVGKTADEAMTEILKMGDENKQLADDYAKEHLHEIAEMVDREFRAGQIIAQRAQDEMHAALSAGRVPALDAKGVWHGGTMGAQSAQSAQEREDAAWTALYGYTHAEGLKVAQQAEADRRHELRRMEEYQKEMQNAAGYGDQLAAGIRQKAQLAAFMSGNPFMEPLTLLQGSAGLARRLGPNSFSGDQWFIEQARQRGILNALMSLGQSVGFTLPDLRIMVDGRQLGVLAGQHITDQGMLASRFGVL